MPKKIILTGGGTAGHVTPNLALLPRLRKDGWDVVYIGSKTGIEKELAEASSKKQFRDQYESALHCGGAFCKRSVFAQPGSCSARLGASFRTQVR